MTFLSKPMQLADRIAFQNWFAEMHVLLGAPINMALFVRKDATVGISRLAVSGVGRLKLEAHSPGGWDEVQALAEPGWSLLVGHADVAERLGVQIG